MTSSATQQGSEQATDKTAIRPFRVNVPEAEPTELRKHINAARWPESTPALPPPPTPSATDSRRTSRSARRFTCSSPPSW